MSKLRIAAFLGLFTLCFNLIVISVSAESVTLSTENVHIIEEDIEDVEFYGISLHTHHGLLTVDPKWGTDSNGNAIVEFVVLHEDDSILECFKVMNWRIEFNVFMPNGTLFLNDRGLYTGRMNAHVSNVEFVHLPYGCRLQCRLHTQLDGEMGWKTSAWYETVLDKPE